MAVGRSTFQTVTCTPMWGYNLTETAAHTGPATSHHDGDERPRLSCHASPWGQDQSILHATDWSAACRLLAAWVAHGGMLHMTEPVLCVHTSGRSKCVPRPQFKLLSPACCLCWCGSAQIVCASPRPTFSGGCPATTTGGDVAPALLRCCHVTWPPHTAW